MHVPRDLVTENITSTTTIIDKNAGTEAAGPLRMRKFYIQSTCHGDFPS